MQSVEVGGWNEKQQTVHTLVTVWKIKGANKGGLSNIKCTCTFNLHTITLIDTASKLYTF